MAAFFYACTVFLSVIFTFSIALIFNLLILKGLFVGARIA